MAKATIRGVRDAMRVLEEAGGILSKQTIRTATEQGIQFTLDHSISFRQASLKEALGIPKRASSYRPTVGRRTVELPSDRRSSMYVCKKNTYIQEEDIKDLLGVCPAEWKIREATLTTIADYYPDMDPTTFRLSLLRAVEQAREGKAKIKHPNAWLKAAFEQNGAPLITARDIEAQVTRGQGAKTERWAVSQADLSSLVTQPEEERGPPAISGCPRGATPGNRPPGCGTTGESAVDDRSDRAGAASRDSGPRQDRGGADRLDHPHQRPRRTKGKGRRKITRFGTVQFPTPFGKTHRAPNCMRRISARRAPPRPTRAVQAPREGGRTTPERRGQGVHPQNPLPPLYRAFQLIC